MLLPLVPQKIVMQGCGVLALVTVKGRCLQKFEMLMDAKYSTSVTTMHVTSKKFSFQIIEIDQITFSGSFCEALQACFRVSSGR